MDKCSRVGVKLPPRGNKVMGFMTPPLNQSVEVGGVLGG